MALARHGTQTLPGVLLLGVALLGSSPETAAAAELSLVEPAACVTLDELSFRVERLLGQPLASAEALRLSLRVEQETGGFAARLEVERPDSAERGVRSLRASSCAELTESLAIAIVVALGDGEQPPAAAPEPSPVQESSPAPASPEALPPPAAAGEAESSPGPTLAASAWALVDSGTLPAAALGAALGLGLEWQSVQLRAIGTFVPEREGKLSASDPRSPGVSIGLVAGGAVGCIPVALQSSSVGMAVCAGAELGQLSGTGTRVIVPYQRRALWAAARVELAARVGLGSAPLSLELLASALAPFTRDEFILRDLGEVHRPASVVGRLGLGLTLAVD